MATILAIILMGGLSGLYIGEAPYVEHNVPEKQHFIVDEVN